ncbi:PucR-like helix-turn-helix protein [Paraburkholderia sp. BL6669N2]|uniref:PucR family transcriptional regulator n=1 Tax=Paraburkholderia sp. BL6669N2 TaxID=1938807 RepID=UPI000E255139|nr:helix-turn-helix domain-containing protein [Paraburkholderia sp. BL6669N2]REG52134.1 PucR-like helix-turn-helix protein [Paraburkholderia sp. BL6669N2]
MVEPAVSFTVPEISSQLHDKIAALAKDPSILVERIYSSLMKIEGYETLPPAVRDDIFQSITKAADLWFGMLLAGSPPAGAVMADVEESARRRVHQRVPLQSMLRAFQLGSREIWRVTTELARANQVLTDELFFSIPQYLFDYFDGMAQIVTKAYAVEEYHQTRWRDSVLHQLYTVVFHTPDDKDSFLEAVGALGLDATLPRVALAIDAALDKLPPDIRTSECNRLALTVSRHFSVEPEMLVHVWHRGRIVAWVPCGRSGTISQCDRAALDCAEHVAASEHGVRAIGVGLMNQGAPGWAASAAEAIRAMELAPQNRANRKVHRYSSIALEESVRAKSNVLRYLESLVTPLDNEPDLLATLTTFLSEGRRRRSTAEALGIHPNTLVYRLERIESLLGASLDSAEWIAKLDIALKLRR